MWELVRAGGWLMLPLFICSIITVTVIVERFIRLRSAIIIPDKLRLAIQTSPQMVAQLLQQNYQHANSTLGRILLAGIRSQSETEQFAKVQMECAASDEILSLEKRVNVLGTMSAVSPLLGLLGTVVGIIEAFLVVDMGTNISPTLMIPGISKALIATAMGMVVAIPALIAYRYFQRLVNDYVIDLEKQASLFHAQLFYRKAGDLHDKSLDS
ncbi:MotA/TolQ/ExbB proton channel family protein [Acinetobacter nectaris]|uniref:MotA/TolQ/ExbB proton channel family protein n=1 Tax=Acinetobacter nectaris TaxID=1219382 RepID=UPI001F3BE82E|nr:MotA/TolQ/ExbB proton channel family protein [Acinetobacter nectaris]MCF8998113.1 MotA/TolQ/ExbB proton channel family protein [Acinetobacter nectaris]MCF9026961.1 MotA/TolQ/ExbB proton channel family protein [Acinetobacter nectaris]MCF9045329.1 MotA/TolQ/ExbB proton channel family protein [Acinetobacter nectaris]